MGNVEDAVSLMERIEGKEIFEGIDFNRKTLTVSYNPSHEENVDTSLEDNPTRDDSIVPGVKVWSIFKRKAGLYGDGNPLIYALKRENGWHFRTLGDEHQIIDRINEIVSKFATMYPVGVTILIPSGNVLNDRIAEIIKSKCKKAIVLKGVISKITTEAVEELVMLPDSDFRKHYGDNFDDAYNELVGYLEKMDKQRNGYFSRHFVKNDEMRQTLNQTMCLSKESYARYARIINNQNVLVVDDTITHGQSIEEACKIIADSYFPKTITVLTLMSKLY